MDSETNSGGQSREPVTVGPQPEQSAREWIYAAMIQKLAALVNAGLHTGEARWDIIDSPKTSHSKPKQGKQFTTPNDLGCTAGCTSERGNVVIVDPQLASLMAAWPTLSVHIKAAIRALVGVTS